MAQIGHFNINGERVVLRRRVSRSSSITDADVKDAARLADIIRKMSDRITELESERTPDYVEFVFDAAGSPASASTHEFHHGFTSPVRFWLTWASEITDPTPALVNMALYKDTQTSTLDTLVLAAHFTGRAVVRVEKAQAGVSL